MKRLLSVILAILVCCMSFTSVLGVFAIDTSDIADEIDNSSKRLSISKNTTGPRYYVDANGNPVHLFGMARCQGHGVYEEYVHGGTVSSLAEHYADLGMNYMRLAISPSGMVGDSINDPPKLTTDAEIDAYIEQRIDPEVQAIIAQGMYVGLDLHRISLEDVLPDETGVITAEQASKYVRANHLPLLKRLAVYYKDEPMIANIEIWNEPSIGLPTGSDGIGWRQTLRQYFIDAVAILREIDPTRVLIVSDDNAGWGWNIDSFWNGYYDDLGDNVVYSAHVSHDQFDVNGSYSSYSNWAKSIASSKNICIMFNEVEDEPSTSTDVSISNFCKFLEETKNTYHISACLWRPHEDYITRTQLWGSNGWAASYTGSTLKLKPTINWFKADGVASLNGWGEEVTTLSNGNAISAPGSSTGYTKEYARVLNANCDEAGGDITFTKRNYHTTAEANRIATDLTGYEYVIVKLKFASKAIAEYALSRTGNGTPFITMDDGASVSFADYKAALNANADAAKACELITLVLPLSKKLSGCYKKLSMDLDYSKQNSNTETLFYTIDFATADYAKELLNGSTVLYADKVMELEGNHTYTAEGYEWYPQLAIPAADRFVVSRSFSAIKFSIAIPNYTTLRNNMSFGSASSLGGGSFTYSPALDLGVYFEGHDVKGIGVTKINLFNILDKNADALAAGESVTLTLPLSGLFTDGGVIESIQFMFAHSTKAAAFNQKTFTVSDIEFISDTLYLSNAPNFTFKGNKLEPQLSIGSYNEFAVKESFNKIKFDLRLPDVVKLRNAMKAGSKSTAGGGSFSYNAEKDLGIYFSGTAVSGVGVTQAELFNLFNLYEEELAAGDTLTVVLPLSGKFNNYGLINGMNVMLSNGTDAAQLAGSVISISNIEFFSTELKLKNGPEFTMVGGWYSPQLSVNSEFLTVSPEFYELQFDIALENAEKLVANMSYGSDSTLGGGGTSYGGTALGIYFTGVGVNGIGITQGKLLPFLGDSATLAKLAAGETVTAKFNVEGVFPENAVITGMKFMVAHPGVSGKDHSVFEGAKISFSNLEFKMEELAISHIDKSFELYGGPDYTLTGSAWSPQLTVNTAKEYIVSSNMKKMKLDIKLPDFKTLRSLMKWGSSSSQGGGSFGYGATDLAIFFSGTNVSGVGITQGTLFKAFDNNYTSFAAGKTVTLTLPISGTFTDGGVITALNFMVTHGDNAASFSGKSISISNIEFIEEGTDSLLIGGPKYSFSGSEWYPQLSVKTAKPYKVTPDTHKIKLNVRIPNYSKLRPLMKWGSRSSLGGGSFGYGPSDLGIYFEGASVSGIGVTQGDLFKAFDDNSEALSAGKTVTLTLPISGEFATASEITSLEIMVTHGGGAIAFGGEFIALSNVELIEVFYAQADLNCDEVVNSLDLIILKKLLFEVDVTVTNKNQGDISKDGKIDIIDYVKLKKAILTAS